MTMGVDHCWFQVRYLDSQVLKKAGLRAGQIENPPVSPFTKGGYFVGAGFTPARQTVGNAHPTS